MDFKQKSKIYKDTIVKQKKIEQIGGIVIGFSLGSQIWWLLILYLALMIWLRKTEKITEQFEIDHL